MITTYAFGRNLPRPQITLSQGLIQGGNTTYYFWYKGRNRAGFSIESEVLELIIPDNSSLVISGLTFDQLSFEDWRSFSFILSVSNDVNTGRIFYKRDNFDENEELLFNEDVTVNNPNIFSPRLVTNISLLPQNAPHGFRTSVNNVVYEFVENSTRIANNVTVIQGNGGNWELLSGRDLIESLSDCDLALEMIPENALIRSSLTSLFDVKPIKFYIINNTIHNISGELNINYVSGSKISFFVRLIGYLNMQTFALDTQGVNDTALVPYPEEKITLSKPLSADIALVLEVTPNLSAVTTMLFQGTTISLYPRIENFTLLREPSLVGEPVTTILALQTLNEATIRDGQIRHVRSKRRYYFYDSNSVESADGNFVITPANSVGRWLSVETDIRDNSITLPKLALALRSALSDNLTSIISISTGSVTAFTLDFATISEDYIRLIVTGIDALTPITLDFTSSVPVEVGTSIEKVVELNYGISPVLYNNSIRFPDGQILINGLNSKDLMLFQLLLDGNNNLIKRIIPIAQDV